MIWLLLVLLGCQPADPELVAVREALTAWEEGVGRLDANEPEAARESFARAAALRPDDPLLGLWEARAAAAADDLDGAIALLDRVIARYPELATARYNRAAYKARRGDPVEVIKDDLVRAVADGATHPRDILDDPDFESIIGDPVFDGFLPESALTISVDSPSGSVFWGSEFDIRLRIAGAGEAPIGVTAEGASGPVTLVSVVDDQNPSTQGVFRDLTWTFRVVGAGDVSFGPFHAWAGERRGVVPAVTFEAAAPEGKQTPPAELPPILFSTPSEVRGRGDIPSARLVEDSLLVLFSPGDRVVIDPLPTRLPVRYEHRVRSKTIWVLERYPSVGEGADVKVKRGGVAIFEAKPKASSG